MQKIFSKFLFPLFVVVALGVSLTPALSVFAVDENPEESLIVEEESQSLRVEDPKIAYCHLTDSTENPWSAVWVSVSADVHKDHHSDYPYSGPVKESGQPDNEGKQADQWCKDNAPEVEPTTGILTVVKVFDPVDIDASPDDFSFKINGGSSTAFESDGSNDVELDLEDGPFTVTEVDPGDKFDVSYNGCSEIKLTDDGATCTITNTVVTNSETPRIELTKTAVYDAEHQKVTYTINWNVFGANVNNLTITDTLPTWTDGIVGSVDTEVHPTTPDLNPGDLNFHPVSPTDNREIIWELGNKEEGSSGSITFAVELWAKQTCEIDANEVSALATYGDEEGTVTAKASSDGVKVNDPHCDEPEPQICDAKVNLLENGSFENPVLGNGTWSIVPDSNPLLKWLVAWTSAQTGGILGLEIQNHVAGDPYVGEQHAELDGDHPVTISQTVSTIIGKTYDLAFAYSARPGRDAADNTIQVLADGNVLGADLANDGTANGNTVWGNETRSFVATGTSTEIKFKDTGTDTSFGGYIDNVSLRCNPDPEEPRTADITIVKETEGGDGEFHFNGLSGEDGFDLTTVEGSASETFTVPADTYVITENVPTGWDLTNVSCEYDEESVGESVEDGKEVTVGPGDHVTCTFTNTKTQEPPSCPLPYTDDSDNSGAIRFENPIQGYVLGSINGQNGWSATGPYDQAVVSQSTYPSFDDQSLRMSDAITSGSFGDWVFAQPITNAAGEVDSTNGTFSPGTLQSHFEAQFDIASVLPCIQQPGLHISVSPDRGDGSRMSYLRFEDDIDGLDIFFYDVQGTSNPANFVETQIADGLERSIPHKVKFVMDFEDGASNDVVKIYLDGVLVHTGTSWENYYRYDSEASAEQSPRIVKTLIFQARGTATPANAGNGYLFDNLTMASSTETPEIYACSDKADNDEDQLIDSADPGCHSDGDAGNSGTYVPSDNDESNSTDSNISSGGGGGSRSKAKKTGQVLGAETQICDFAIDTYMRRGYRNNAVQVRILQALLNKYVQAGLIVDGVYGPSTEAAVKTFQIKYGDFILKPWGLTGPTGIFYKTTLVQAKNLECPVTPLPIPTPLINWSLNRGQVPPPAI